jgi:carboxyl-terminal processing protease
VGRSIQKPYGIDAPHPVELGDTPVPTDTTERPEFRTDGGRTVYGGGGIHPDLIVRPDSLTPAEIAYRQATLRSAEFRAAQTAFTVEALRANPQLTQGFAVTPAMRDAYYRALVAREIQLDRAVFDGAQSWVDQEIGHSLTYSKWGEQAARRRLNVSDKQVMTAADLLRRASTPQSLFTLAESFDAARAAMR